MVIDPELLERLRRSGIRIDREGWFVHEREEVRHEGLKQALFRWLDRLPAPDHRYVLRLDAGRYAYVDVDDTPLVARSARLDAGPPERLLLALSDGSEEALDPATLTVDEAGVLRAWVRGGRLEARLANAAAAVAGERVQMTTGAVTETGTVTEAAERPVLELAGRRFPLPARRGS
jgi:hypothetical protein